ncbi:MAG TPA: alpha-1,4-glucan--maltose-1-phosphate maltosyltransferase [Mycobacteriales bacterium]|nr:alpha-1,4-glucan--maltose-1-phosphate maltosyltransferase [Mycobacteriales bacterium]
MIGRIAITEVRPQVSCGRWPARAVVGETFPVQATVFREGHDLIGAAVLLRAPESGKGGGKARRIPMRALGNDRYGADVTVDAPGRWTFAIEAYADPIATWQHGIELKHAAGQNVALELEEGARLFEAALSGVPKGVRTAPYRAAFEHVVKSLRGADADVDSALRDAASPDVRDALVRYPLRRLVTVSDKLSVAVDRPRALYGAWYEMFPRSEGAADGRSGTFRTAMRRLDAIAEMGFDVVYLPPIHPIGTAYRKGPNNSLESGPDDPGSPWAIGSADGGHDAVHPDLGTIEDFDAFVARAGELGMEVALDLALQCSPDHPWVAEHPEWFTTRADGTIAYAENPPKKYQDIYPLDFDNDPSGLYAEVLRVFEHWIAHGVEIFRVDNPHTKPLNFWEWLISEVKARHPDVVFLAEAFTRPPMMQMLAKIGFTQSYTYFTWRNTKAELEEYLTELSQTDVAEYMRPNFFVNTPDILHAYLQQGGRPAFKIRAVLAATMTPSWGVYAGYEHYENVPVREGSEEYLDSEKYQYKPRDWSEPGLAPYLTRLNEIRRRHPALHWLRNLRFHRTDDDATIAYSKRHGDDVVLTVVSLDPQWTRETVVHLDMAALGLDPHESFEVRDEIADTWYVWHGPDNYVRLDPHHEPAHVFSVKPL